MSEEPFHDYIDNGNSGPVAAEARPEAETRKATHRHKRRGTEYELIGYGRMQSVHWRDPGTPADNCPHGPSVNCREVAIYRSVDDGSLWVRPLEEFHDGRFVAVEDAI